MPGSEPKWWDSKHKLKEQNRRSKKQEEKRAKQQGGKRQSGSGSSYRAPQDVRTPDYLEQLKYTDAVSFSIKVKEWLNLRRDALNTGRAPRMVIDFEKHGVRLIIIEESIDG
jgi:hypothetical protein